MFILILSLSKDEDGRQRSSDNMLAQYWPTERKFGSRTRQQPWLPGPTRSAYRPQIFRYSSR